MMQRFLSANSWAEISAAAQSSNAPAFVAVSYFSDYGDKILPLPSGSHLVVDATAETVSQGITSPAALIRMIDKGVNIYSVLNLHSKTYVFEKNHTFVGSCNASRMSSSILIESCIYTDEKAIAEAAIDFITTLTLNKLTRDQLIELKAEYKAPKVSKISDGILRRHTLVMDLTMEQGGRRASQVQPPSKVWETYFQIPWLDPPQEKILLQDLNNGKVCERPVVIHNHNMTIEISGAELPRPAILILKKIDHFKFGYSIHRPGSREFQIFDLLLDKIKNPLREYGRRWFIV